MGGARPLTASATDQALRPRDRRSTLSYMRSTTMPMGTVTVRLDADDEHLLDELAAIHGDRSTAVREAIRLLSGRQQRRVRLRKLLDEWEAEDGPLTKAELDETARRFGL
jgi:Arc/MetJ-type ribon-helix-helix transcriptional regulator